VTDAIHVDEERQPDSGALPSAAFYCVASGTYFLGAVGLVNSLRLLGHTEPIFVLDRGLSRAQRELLGREVTLVPTPDDTTPFLLKTVAPLGHPAEVMVLLDADIIVTRPLTDLIERASRGQVLAVEHGQDRFFPEWGELLGLSKASHRPYVTSSVVLAGGDVGGRVLRLMHEAQPQIEIERTPYAVPNPDFASLGDAFAETMAGNPFFYADQDVLNAVLACEIPPSQVELLDRSAEAIVPFTGLRVADETTLRCVYDDGTQPYAVHQILTKPWVQPTVRGVYTDLLMRLLLGSDVAVRVPKAELPLYLRRGPLGQARRAASSLGWRLRYGRTGRPRFRALLDRSPTR
jgi:hypothetical protein